MLSFTRYFPYLILSNVYLLYIILHLLGGSGSYNPCYDPSIYNLSSPSQSRVKSQFSQHWVCYRSGALQCSPGKLQKQAHIAVSGSQLQLQQKSWHQCTTAAQLKQDSRTYKADVFLVAVFIHMCFLYVLLSFLFCTLSLLYKGLQSAPYLVMYLFLLQYIYNSLSQPCETS